MLPRSTFGTPTFGSPRMEPNELNDQETERTYMAYVGDEHLTFDPLKDLNLPGSYEEVRNRYHRLRNNRSWEALN